MKRLFGDEVLPAEFRGGIIAFGNFDGFHSGHQAVVARAIGMARSEGRPAIVATFTPHPAHFFRPDLPPFRLTTMDQRQRLFAAAGADAMLIQRFDAQVAGLDPASFVQRLTERYGAAAIVTGSDFTFGKGRAGTPQTLRDFGLRAETVDPIEDAGGAISSSRIRAALIAGDCGEATRLLTRPMAIEGVVIHGDKLGRTIGYPTANIDLGDYQRPRYGIYAVRARLDDGRLRGGAANLGIRPSFDPPKELLEPYLFDFSGDLYGRKIEIELIEFLRPEAKFDSLDALTAQMERDCARAKAVLAARPAG